MHRRLAGSVALALALPALGACTGLSLGRNFAGADTYVGAGALAVDDRTETVLVLGRHRGAATAPARAILYAADPDSGSVRPVADLTGRSDDRVLFPEAGVLVMSEADGGDVLELFDRASFALLGSVRTAARYHGTRLSPSRKWVAVADNTREPAPIHLLDATSLAARVIPHAGRWLEAAWMHGSDRLVAALFEGGGDGAPPVARVRAWSVDALAAGGFETDASGSWARPELDVALPGKLEDLCMSFTWIGVSPDDRTVVVPVRDAVTSAYELVLVDVPTRSYRTVPDAKGPVGFTPDGKTVVSYRARDRATRACRWDAPGAPPKAPPTPAPGVTAPGAPAEPAATVRDDLLLVDVASLATRLVLVPDADPFNFDVVGATIVVAPSGDRPGGVAAPLLLVDTGATPTGHLLPGTHAHLQEYVLRPPGELWLVSHGALGLLDVAARRYERVSLAFRTDHVNYLPKKDWLVLDDPEARRGVTPDGLAFYAPAARAVARALRLPE
ncbi:MAG: hypothetical protein HY908_19230 [Myxococcales bacterium]|nr:hypothetical protein [Myxococcales bacterium]